MPELALVETKRITVYICAGGQQKEVGGNSNDRKKRGRL
jgi:hypothetical protein